MNAFSKFFNFSFIAGAGWLLDISLYSILVHMNLRVLLANSVSAFIGVAFSYFMSMRLVFYYSGCFLLTKFIVYVLYNCVAIMVFSFIIEQLSIYFNLNPIVIKCGVTPFSFLINFVMLSLLVENRFQYRLR